ncbi:MAG: hypothetical protein V1726_00560 [Methanobacteriota archaeon]
MNKHGSLGIATLILFFSVILIAATAASILIGNIVSSSSGSSPGDNDLNRITQETVNELTTYLQIKDIHAKYSMNEHEPAIHTLAILIKPLVSTKIDLSTLTIEVSNGQHLHFFTYSAMNAPIGSSSLFEHPLWNNTSTANFSALVLLDTDHSILDYHIINAQNDIVYLLLKLPDDISMKKDDTVMITLLPGTGITRTITVTAPLPMRSIVSLLDY